MPPLSKKNSYTFRVILVMGSSKSSGKVKEKQVKTKIKTNFDEKMYNPQREL